VPEAEIRRSYEIWYGSGLPPIPKIRLGENPREVLLPPTEPSFWKARLGRGAMMG